MMTLPEPGLQPSAATPAPFDFMSRGGELGRLTREHDWAATPLGPPQDWPEVLKTTLRLVLTSHHPMFVWWGPDLFQFYNDAYRKTMGPERHPSALGQRGRECWAEIWPIIGPQIDAVMAGGEATWHEDQLVPVTRHGRREDVWWTYGYSPIQDSSGVRGVLVVCNDVTQEHLARDELLRLNSQLVDEVRQREQAERHLAVQLELVDSLRGLMDSQEIATAAFAVLSRQLPMARISYAEIDEANDSFSISHAWHRADLQSIQGMHSSLSEFGSEVIAALRRGQVVSVADITTDERTVPCVDAYNSLDARAFLSIPMIKAGRLVAALTLLHSNAYGWAPSEVSLVENAAERIWNAIERARAEAQRRQAEEDLHIQRSNEHERLRSLFRQAPGFMCILHGPEHVFEFVNEAYVRFVGKRDLLGKTVREAFPELDGQVFFTLLDQVYSSGRPYTANDVSVFLQREPGAPASQAYIDFVYQPILDAQGKVSGIFVEGIDTTERRHAKASLEASEERLKEGLIAARMAVWDYDLVTGQVKFSDNTNTTFGGDWSSIEQIWKNVHPDDLLRLQAARAQAVATRGSYEEVVRIKRADRSHFLWLQVHGKVVCDAQGNPCAIRGVSIDVSARKRAEEALREADRRKDEFLAMLAHELRNPLAPISAAAHLLNIAGHDERRVRQTSEIITRQVGHMTSLIDDLLDVSRVNTGLIELDKQPLDLKRIVAESLEQVRPFIEARSHHLVARLDAADATVLGDHKRLVQVLTNLLQNAAKYTPEAGLIELDLKVASGEVEVSVRDNGMGIDPQLLPHIFELFTQEKRSSDRSQGGLGLGLSLVRSLLALHGGRVTAASGGSGQGATFTLHLPLLAGASNILPQTARDGRLPLVTRPLRLLVVDDNNDAARTLAMFLESAGHEVYVENEPRAVLERASRDAPDVYLLDIGLPGMDGNELARRLRHIPDSAHATFIAITGYGQEYDKDTATAAGFDHYFVKPADTSKLAELLARLEPASRQ